ncbi:enolase-phosphatase E1-like [Battus philenor]|uniref:enolase-phosphatase E1-like n=1 Tax=Battus philenor TaxID=42288 RepID=UPI0035CF1AA8
MNFNKHKNKKRTKVHPKPPPKGDIKENENVIQDLEIPENLEAVLKAEEVTQDLTVSAKSDNVLIEEKKIQNIEEIVESASEVTTTNIGETPVKPKRNKGKKKKHNVSDTPVESTKDQSEIKEIVEEEKNVSEILTSDTVIQENIVAQPCARKKKNKSKKQSKEVLLENKSDNEVQEFTENRASESKEDTIVDESPNEFKALNKKGKKKKRRHDSEKSEKTDEQVTCTAAFSELSDIKHENDSLERSVNDNIQDLEISKENIPVSVENLVTNLSTEDPIENELMKSTDTLSRKKKRKEKKHPLLHEQENREVIILPNADVTSDNTTSGCTEVIEKDNQMVSKEDTDTKDIPDYTTIDEPKQKAMIAKPVQRKPAHDKHKYADTPQKNETLNLVTVDTSNFEENKLEDTSNSAAESKLILPDILCQNLEEGKASIENLKTTETFKTPEKREETKESLTKSIENIEQDPSNLNNELVSQNILNEKKAIPLSQKEVTNLSSSEVENKKVEVDKEEKLNEISVNTPDFIQIPRSNSQQMFADNNNNTIIHEITNSDEMKLGIPVLTSNIIQGSGETPVSTPKIIPTDISVTEIESTLNKEQERTDLKSKMMAVNQDLEELKISLEKSLAELTSLEDDEEKIINKTSENMESNIEEETKLKTDVSEDANNVYKPLADRLNDIENKFTASEVKDAEDILKAEDCTVKVPVVSDVIPPICPSRKDRKGKGKSKKRGRREPESHTSQSSTTSTENKTDESKQESKNEEKAKTSDEKAKQQSSSQNDSVQRQQTELNFEPIENFEDALSSSVDEADVNKTFEMIANELNNDAQNEQPQKESTLNKPEINITPPLEDEEKERNDKNINPVSQPKNLLGHPNIPVSSSKTDYKKEKNKTPNSKQARVKIKDAVEPETDPTTDKNSKESQTENKVKFTKDRYEIESFSYVTNEKAEYVYKYSFRKVFLVSVCHVCRKDLKQARVACKFCNLVFYCGQKHKDEDWPRHQSLCFAVSTIAHLKDQKHIYADAKNVYGQNYRLIRMQMILSCEKILKRKLLAWEQEALLYPRTCADEKCREWKQSKLMDCEGCGQVSYCAEHPDHLPVNHLRWCKSYALYQKMVLYQQTNGRLVPKFPGKVMVGDFIIPDKINEVLASMYEETIDMTDVQYAALTQLATAPLTTAFCYQLFRQIANCPNGITKKSTFTVHAVGSELQFEADSLNKWEVFLLHLKPDVKDLRVVLIGRELNPSNLPLDLLGNVNLCENCRTNKRRLQFSFQDKKSYKEYWSGDEFIVPDIVCAFNPSIYRSSMYIGSEYWSTNINCIFKQKVPFVLTSHSLEELTRDLASIDSCSEASYKVLIGPKLNPFGSVRPDRNFVTDDETPLVFKNNSFSLLCGG